MTLVSNQGHGRVQWNAAQVEPCTCYSGTMFFFQVNLTKPRGWVQLGYTQTLFGEHP